MSAETAAAAAALNLSQDELDALAERHPHMGYPELLDLLHGLRSAGQPVTPTELAAERARREAAVAEALLTELGQA